MVFARFFGRDPALDAARTLYVALSAQARHPVFYAHWGVPDTLDGRFDCVALHAFLVLNRLKAETAPDAAALAQHLVDTFVEDMDRTVRELGVGDMGVARRVKAMAQALYGRSAVYSGALADETPAALDEALRRNLYGTVESPDPAGVAAMAVYVRAAAAALAAGDLAALQAAKPGFPEPTPGQGQ
jgi:cytochrome b pre-mRNA-processing protein 3